jgi:hypothetical protein
MSVRRFRKPQRVSANTVAIGFDRTQKKNSALIFTAFAARAAREPIEC